MNGNDVLIIIEDNQAEIELKFLQQFSAEELIQHLYDEGTLESLKIEHDFDKFANEWAEATMQGQADQDYDRMKEMRTMPK